MQVVYVSGRKRPEGEMNGKSGNINNCCSQIYPRCAFVAAYNIDADIDVLLAALRSAEEGPSECIGVAGPKRSLPTSLCASSTPIRSHVPPTLSNPGVKPVKQFEASQDRMPPLSSLQAAKMRVTYCALC